MIKPGQREGAPDDEAPGRIPGRVRRILVIALPALGDILRCTPMLAALRERYPAARVDVLVRRGHAGILAGNDNVDSVIEVASHPTWLEYAQQAWRLIGRYDVAISNGVSTRAAVYSWFSARFRASVSAPAGAKHGRARRLRDVSVAYDANCHTLVLMRRLAHAIGLAPDNRIVLPRHAGSAERIDELLGDDPRPLAVLHPTPGLAVKRWTAQGWAETAAGLCARGFRVVASGAGAQAERAYIETCFGATDTLSLAGELRLGDLTELLGRAALFVGVDTLATHMAAALGTPTVALFGPSDPVVWGPWPSTGSFSVSPYARPGTQQVGNVFLLQAGGECTPRVRPVCTARCENGGVCMRGITPGEVLEASTRVREGTPRGNRGIGRSA